MVAVSIQSCVTTTFGVVGSGGAAIGEVHTEEDVQIGPVDGAKMADWLRRLRRWRGCLRSGRGLSGDNRGRGLSLNDTRRRRGRDTNRRGDLSWRVDKPLPHGCGHRVDKPLTNDWASRSGHVAGRLQLAVVGADHSSIQRAAQWRLGEGAASGLRKLSAVAEHEGIRRDVDISDVEGQA